jgi:superfamily II DNA/RNA helicase
VDFIAQSANGDIEYFQVSQTVMDSAVFDREIASLDKIDDHNPKFLITMDYLNISHKGIKQVNLLDWLLK